MPKIKVEEIVSFSSEDPAFPASNLLSGDPAKKWKCNIRGENSASVVLQLDKATKITGLDIGNEHSAYIEVLVNRCSNGDSADFKVLLSTSSFMSAMDSRQSTNVNKVRMFTHDQLSQPECKEKWDRIKIVCAQPFNKHIQYGLSFIAFYSAEVKEQKAEVAVKALGKFTLRPESPQEFSVGSLFATRNDSTSSTLTTAAAIRLAANSSAALHTKSPLSDKFKKSKEISILPSTSRLSDVEVEIDENKRKRNRMDILYAKDEEDSNAKIDKLIAMKVEEKDKLDIEKKQKEKQEAERKEKRDAERKENEEAERKEKDKASKIERTKKLQAMSDKKIHKVIYKIDSDDSSSDSEEKNIANNTKRDIKTLDTHNNKRKAMCNGITHRKKIKKLKKPFHRLLEGVVMTISGIQNPDRADLRSKAVSLGAKYKRDWDSTCTHLICAFVNTPKFLQVRGNGKIVTKQWILDCHGDRKRLPWRRYALDRNDYGSESEEEILEQDIENSEESDLEIVEPSTSEEIYSNVKDEKVGKNLQSSSKDHEQTDFPQLPHFFSNKQFFIDDDLIEIEKQLLRKYVTAYNGTILDDLFDATVILTSIENVVNLKSKCPNNVDFVSVDWVWECHNKQRCVSPTDFLMI